MKWILPILLVLFACFESPTAHAAKKEIYVGVYGFAPYYDFEKGRGRISQVLEILNSMQNEYQFRVVEITSRRRYQSFTDHKIDMLFFEDPRWGWAKIPHWIYESKVTDIEVYIAKKSVAINQSYFDSLTGKSIAAISGYHYGFANFNSDESYLRSKFNIYLVSHNYASVRLVLHDQVQVGVVPRSYITQFLLENPTHRNTLLVSDKVDQRYDLKILVNPQIAIPRTNLDKLMKELINHPRYQKLFAD